MPRRSVNGVVASFGPLRAELSRPLVAAVAPALPAADLPEDFELVIAAAPPVVNFPIMGTLDPRGRLFVGDAAGLNLNRKALEEQLPETFTLRHGVDRG